MAWPLDIIVAMCGPRRYPQAQRNGQMMAQQKNLIGAAAAFAAVFALGAQAPAPAPTPAPAPDTPNLAGVRMMAPIPDSGSTGVSYSGRHHYGPHVLTDADHALFTQAFAAADHGDWGNARTLAAKGADKTARDLITWLYLLDENSGASFGEIDSFLRDHLSWPRRDTLYSRAEKAMADGMDANLVMTWFGSREPVSGFGNIKLGAALIKSGKRKEGIDRIRKGWIENSFAPNDEIAILTKYGEHFSAETQHERLQKLLWNDDRGGAERQMARVETRDQHIAEARIKLARGLGSPHAVVAKLSENIRDNPGILFDEARAYRRQGDEEHAGRTLMLASESKESREYPLAFWPERHIDARDALKDGEYKLAYNLVSNSQLSSGSEFADAEFLSGWIALRFMKNEKLARGHFEKLAAGVATPISRARAQYWLGRTEEALGNTAEAADHYHRAAQDAATFYGQLALARIEEHPVLHINESTPDTGAIRAAFAADDRSRAMRVLAEMGEDDLLRSFATRIMLETPDGPHIKLLADLMLELGNRALAVRAAKQASYNDAYLMMHLFPVIDVPKVEGLSNPPELALVHALARQESEFDPGAVSSAGALGLMQMMPGSARATASAHGLRYSLSDLTADPKYNMQLGQAHIADFLAEWGGSYVLAIASYNAGDNNVRKWIATNGDPRTASVDPVDWIELIPFGETRNYVMRVLENTGVYRNRIAGSDQKLRIIDDLYSPREVDVKVLHYTPRSEREAPRPSKHHASPKAKPKHKAHAAEHKPAKKHGKKKH